MKTIAACLLWFLMGLLITRMYWPIRIHTQETIYKKYIVFHNDKGKFKEPFHLEEGDYVETMRFPKNAKVTGFWKSK